MHDILLNNKIQLINRDTFFAVVVRFIQNFMLENDILLTWGITWTISTNLSL
jgi:hypothetical protein